VDVRVQSLDGKPVAVNYLVPTVENAKPTLTTSCAPVPGSSFPVGSTSVTCTATYAIQQQVIDTCRFNVVVLEPPRLSATSFVAFGDSITAGEVSTNLVLRLVAPNAAYPAVLEGLLDQRYTQQQVSVVNAGKSGEKTADGLSRLPGELSVTNAEVLLLQEGVNDLNVGGEAAEQPALDNLRSMIRRASDRGLRVFVGTLLPQRPGHLRANAYPYISDFNTKLNAMAANEGATVVDLYQAFLPQVDTLIGDDGLHPTEAGYRLMASTFFDSIKSRLELTTPSPATLVTR
jgi:lysophospholipase L1-like esterase